MRYELQDNMIIITEDLNMDNSKDFLMEIAELILKNNISCICMNLEASEPVEAVVETLLNIYNLATENGTSMVLKKDRELHFLSKKDRKSAEAVFRKLLLQVKRLEE